MAKTLGELKLEASSDSGFYVAVLKSSGEVYIKRFSSPELELSWLQEAVGGYIEIVRGFFLPGEAYLVLNENGLFLDLPFNLFASFLYSGGAHPIVGDVVLCCDFDAFHALGVPDAYASPPGWLYGVLVSYGIPLDTPVLE